MVISMYAGTTIHGKSGRLVGVHQKIDRISRRNLAKLLEPGSEFPDISGILHFEGNNGPDGIKRKSPSVDEPWHFIDPSNHQDRDLVRVILDHHANLTEALRTKNTVRAAFEAAWLAHAIADGLTPAHHYPLGDKIEELWGKPHEERLSVLDKNLVRGINKRDTISKNWEYWGAKGVFVTHWMFEWGVATSLQSAKLPDSMPNKDWLRISDASELERVFMETMNDIYSLNMYERYWKKGWTAKLARQTRDELIPKICAVTTYAWYTAYRQAADGSN